MIFSKLKTGLSYFFFFLLLGSAWCLTSNFRAQADTLPLDKANITENTNLQTVQGESGEAKFNTLVRDVIIPYVKQGFIGVAIILVLYYVFQFVISTSTENLDTQKTNLFYAAIGFALIGLSLHIVQIFAPGEGQNLENIGDKAVADSTILNVIIFIQYLAGAVAILFMVIAAMRIITAQGVEEEVENQKKNFTWGAFGLMVIMLSRVVVEIVYDRDGTADPTSGAIGFQGSKQIYEIIVYVLQFLGITATLALIVAGIFYVISMGDEEKTNKAKSIIFATVIGIVIITLAYAFVAYVFRPAAGDIAFLTSGYV